MNPKFVVVVSAAAIVLVGCGTAAPPAHHSRPKSAVHARTYPGQAADAALCRTYNADMQAGDLYDLGNALQLAQGNVSPKLADDIATVVNSNGSLQQDMQNQLAVTEDCALVVNGVQPHQ
jgi:hypothetical protein